tara:strand:- start:57 stop:308 length:252 start_codon:yes stop_codon:yes gene_type:complete
MDSLLSNNFFNPLAPVAGKKHCDVLYLVLILSLIIVTFAVVGVVGSVFTKTKGATVAALLVLLQVALVHHVYRVIYTMCLNTV